MIYRILLFNISTGVEWNNGDLYVNYNKAGSWDLNDDDDDPMPDHTKGFILKIYLYMCHCHKNT